MSQTITDEALEADYLERVNNPLYQQGQEIFEEIKRRRGETFDGTGFISMVSGQLDHHPDASPLEQFNTTRNFARSFMTTGDEAPLNALAFYVLTEAAGPRPLEYDPHRQHPSNHCAAGGCNHGGGIYDATSIEQLDPRRFDATGVPPRDPRRFDATGVGSRDPRKLDLTKPHAAGAGTERT